MEFNNLDPTLPWTMDNGHMVRVLINDVIMSYDVAEILHTTLGSKPNEAWIEHMAKVTLY